MPKFRFRIVKLFLVPIENIAEVKFNYEIITVQHLPKTLCAGQVVLNALWVRCGFRRRSQSIETIIVLHENNMKKIKK